MTVPVPAVTWMLRTLLVTLPVVVAAVAWRTCHARIRVEELEHRKEGIRTRIAAGSGSESQAGEDR